MKCFVNYKELYSVDAPTADCSLTSCFLLSLPMEELQYHLGRNVPSSSADWQVVEAGPGRRSPFDSDCPMSMCKIISGAGLGCGVWLLGSQCCNLSPKDEVGKAHIDQVSSWLF